MGLKFSHSFESVGQEQGIVQEYIDRIEHDLEVEVERILKEETKIGEGKTARVFSISANRFPLPICVKIWKPDVIQLEKKDLVSYRRMQASSPEKEFNLQDELYREGFHYIPRPVAFERVGDYQVMAMEEFPGYTLEQIQAAGATIESPSWRELERIVKNLNIDYHVLHRDLGRQNIFLKTEDSLSAHVRLNGEIYLIDLGLSKRIVGKPDSDDFTLTIGRDAIRYPSDRANLDAIKPYPGKNNLFAH